MSDAANAHNIEEHIRLMQEVHALELRCAELEAERDTLRGIMREDAEFARECDDKLRGTIVKLKAAAQSLLDGLVDRAMDEEPPCVLESQVKALEKLL